MLYFELLTHDNNNMLIWIFSSVPEYYDYGHGTSEEAYDSYGKVSSVFSKIRKSKEKSVIDNSEITSTYFFFFLCFYKGET